MNRENILKVADAIEHAAKKRARPKVGFSMATFAAPTRDFTPDRTGHDCPTVCCIAGWARHLLRPKRRGELWDGLQDEGADWDAAVSDFGLTQKEAARLFLAYQAEDLGVLLDDITPTHAVAVLRHLAETGKVDWSVGAPVDA
jgi:hypothetical protein